MLFDLLDFWKWRVLRWFWTAKVWSERDFRKWKLFNPPGKKKNKIGREIPKFRKKGWKFHHKMNSHKFSCWKNKSDIFLPQNDFTAMSKLKNINPAWNLLFPKNGQTLALELRNRRFTRKKKICGYLPVYFLKNIDLQGNLWFWLTLFFLLISPKS